MPRDWSVPLGDPDPLPDSEADELRASFRTQQKPSFTEAETSPEALQTDFTEAEAAAFLGMAPETLARHRRAGTGPEAYSRNALQTARFAALGWLRGVDPESVPADPYEAAKWTGGGGRVNLGDLRYRREALEAWKGRGAALS